MSSLRLIWGHLYSFQLIYRLTHLSSFRTILSSYRIILNVFRVFWVRLGSFRPILVYLGSFRLIWVDLDSLELIKVYLSSCRLIQTLLGLFKRLIWALVRHLCSFELVLAQLGLLRFNWSQLGAYLGSPELIYVYSDSFRFISAHLSACTVI